MRRFLVGVALLSVAVASGARGENRFVDYLEDSGRSPVDYVLSKLEDHRVVLLGEHHWIRHDVELVLALIPKLPQAGVYILGFEILDARQQSVVDRLVEGDEWQPEVAMKLQREEAWPYQEYLEILHAVWQVNHSRPPGGRTLKLLALGPGSDWRERLLPLGQTYDSFMADRILEHARGGDGVLVYAGLHHVFSRFYQPELPRQDRVEAFMDRMGNILWRSLGEDVFTIVLHRPVKCKQGKAWSQCLPVLGAIDCAAATLDRPVGFDVADSPFAELRLEPTTLYALGYPAPRLVDFTDGYIWSAPIDAFEGATLIPLADFAPDAESLEEVMRRNPFSDGGESSREELEVLWAKELASLQSLSERFGWSGLANWEKKCHESE